MSTDFIGHNNDNFLKENISCTIFNDNETIPKRKISNFKLNKKSTKISNKIRPESALFTMIKLLVEHRNEINVVDSVLSINSNDLDLVQKLNYCMEFLAHIPFSFQYDKLQTKILLDFFHLEDEMQLIGNLEL